MKLILVALTTVFIGAFSSNAQLTNGNFSNFCQTGNAFQVNNCVNNWSNSHGTPTLSGSGTAWMWSYGGRGEGIVANYNFQANCVYTITFRVRTDDRNSGDANVANTATVNLLAANNVPQSTSITFPNVASSQQILSNTMGNYLNNWTNVSVSFSPQNNYNQLWVYPFMQANSNGVSQAEMNIDDITISQATYSTGFALAASSNFGGGVTVSAQANSNPGFVNHWWDVYYAPNGSVSGNSQVPGNATICCNSTLVSFNQNLFVNEWYYIKHGIWNDCFDWRETRKRFRVQIGYGLKGKIEYNIEIEEVDFEPSVKYLDEKNQFTEDLDVKFTGPKRLDNNLSDSNELFVYPNPASDFLNVGLAEMNTSKISEISIFNEVGQLMLSKEVNLAEEDIQLDIKLLPEGIYFAKAIDQLNNVVTKRFLKVQ